MSLPYPVRHCSKAYEVLGCSVRSCVLTTRPIATNIRSQQRRVVYLQRAGNSSCLKTRYNASFTTYMRGLCHGIPSRFLPARADRPGVGVPDALWAVAIGACCSSPNTTQAAAAPGQALQT